MKNFVRLPAGQRLAYFEQASELLGIPAVADVAQLNHLNH